jgi:CPA1 family monovalent cation:H+ antiporter
LFFDRGIEEIKSAKDNSLTNFQRIYVELLDQQRIMLNEMNSHTELDEELIRKYLSLIDLEEFKIREKWLQEIDPAK